MSAEEALHFGLIPRMHRGIFAVLRRLKVFVSGDIGCYSLGALPPFEAMHCSTCMGTGISMAHGMSKVVDENADQKNRPVAIIGDTIGARLSVISG